MPIFRDIAAAALYVEDNNVPIDAVKQLPDGRYKVDAASIGTRKRSHLDRRGRVIPFRVGDTVAPTLDFLEEFGDEFNPPAVGRVVRITDEVVTVDFPPHVRPWDDDPEYDFHYQNLRKTRRRGA